MNQRARTAAIVLLFAVMGGWGVWWWFENMELRPVAQYIPSKAARENPMLAATRLLQMNRHPVTLSPTLAALRLERLPDGVLIIADSEGVTSAAQAGTLRQWVSRGNVLVTRPRWISKQERAVPVPEQDADEDEEVAPDPDTAAVELDPLGSAFGVRRSEAQSQSRRCAAAAEPPAAAATEKNQVRNAGKRLACLQLPGVPHVLEVDTRGTILVSLAGAKAAQWSDPAAEAVRSYAQGRGQLVMVAANYFDNGALRDYDHGELLLQLVRLRGPGARVVIVQRLDVTPWHKALWDKFGLALASAGAALALLLWMALRRFGPMLPAPAAERRSLMEHIAASGAWLWKAPQGRELLLAAARNAALAAVQRRMPELHGMAPHEQIKRLARRSGIAAAELEAALQQPAARRPLDFTRQIRTLQELKNP
jgi:hypothetical protein